MPRGLGNPIRVCTIHVAQLSCQGRCLGAELDGLGELKSVTHDGCALCQAPEGLRPFRVLRRCHNIGCYGRFHQVSIDDLNLGEWLAFYRQRIRRITRLIFGL
jgi:hypothetical protein